MNTNEMNEKKTPVAVVMNVLEGLPARPDEQTRWMADGKTLQSVDARLAKIEGQIRGVRHMAADGRPCIDIVTQIAAVRAALKRVADVVIADHLKHWVNKTSSTEPRSDHDIEELLRVFGQYYK